MNEQAAAAWLKAQEALDQCGDMLTMLREREAAGPVSQWQPPPPEPPRQRQPSTPRPVPPPAPPVADEYARPRHDAAGRIVEIEKFKGTGAQSAKSWEAWIAQYVERQIQVVYEAVGEVLREDVIARFDRLEARIAELERAAGQGLRDAAD